MAANEIVHNGVAYKSLMNSCLPDNVLEKAKREIHETEENIATGKEKLRELLLENNLPFSDDEDMLLRALRNKKFRCKDSLGFVKHLIKAFTEIKRRYGREAFFNVEILKNFYAKSVISMLPFRDSDGSVLLLYRPGVWLQENMSFNDILQTICFLGLFFMEVPATNLTGMVIIIDATHFTLKEVPHFFRGIKLAYPLMKAMPARVKKIVYVNHSTVFESIVRLGTRIFPKKAQDRFEFYGEDLEEFHKTYDSILMPEELGGKTGPMTNEHWICELDKKIQSFLRMWDVMENAGVI